jgi:hypothetical protein
VCENVAFLARLPEENEPSSAVTVWAVPSVFVHCSVAPSGIVTGFGEKLKLAIVACSVTAASAAGIAGRKAVRAEPIIRRSFAVVRMSVLRVTLSEGLRASGRFAVR